MNDEEKVKHASENRRVTTPRELLELFINSLSSGAVYHNWMLFIYFLVSITLSIILNFSAINLGTQGVFEFVFMLMKVVGSAAIAIYVCGRYVEWRFKKLGVHHKGRPSLFPMWLHLLPARLQKKHIEEFENDWKADFREWQKEKIKDKANYNSLSDDQKIKALNAYANHTKEKIESISPIFNPAVFITLFAPLYAVILDKVFSDKAADGHLLKLSLLVTFIVFFLWLFIEVVGGLATLFNRKRDAYKELLEILYELQFELESKQ